MKKFFIIDSITISLLIPIIISIGFRSGASTEHALLKFLDDILKLLDQNKVAIATFMDISKVFDCVDHNILLFKQTIWHPRNCIAMDQ